MFPALPAFAALRALSRLVRPRRPRIFLSYRHRDVPDFVGRLRDNLAARLGRNAVVRDVELLQGGDEFLGTLMSEIARCDVFLAVIGPDWLAGTNRQRRRPLKNPGDVVRLEIAAALANGLAIIPVLVGGAAMPRRGELPTGLKGFEKLQAVEFRGHEAFHRDFERLIEALGTRKPPVYVAARHPLDAAALSSPI